MVPVIAGFSVNGWNVYRALVAHGLSPVALDNDPGSIYWKARRAEIVYVERLGGSELIEALNRTASDERDYVVISATEEAVRTLNACRGRLRPNIRLLFPASEIVDMLLDKQKFYEAARGRFRLSPMYFPESWDSSRIAGDLSFPCILKARTKIYAPGLAKAYRLGNREQLRERLENLSLIPGIDPHDFVLQEWVPGSDSDVVFCLQYYTADSTPAISFVGRKIRQWRPDTGGTASAQALEDDEVLRQTTEFFQGIGMHGICSMEFKRSRKDGELHMIEPTACRADYQEGVATANGYNIPYAAWCDAAGVPYQPGPNGRAVKWLHLGDDCASAAHYVRAGELTWMGWAKSLQGPRSYAIYAPEDRGPFMELMRRKISNRLGRVLPWR